MTNYNKLCKQHEAIMIYVQLETTRNSELRTTLTTTAKCHWMTYFRFDAVTGDDTVSGFSAATARTAL